MASVEVLLTNGASLHVRDRYNHSPLMDAIRFRHTAVVDVLRKGGAHFTQAEHESVCLLFCKAASTCDTHMAKILLDCGADANDSWQDNRTPLHLAACYGHLSIIKLIITKANSAATELSSARHSTTTEDFSGLVIGDEEERSRLSISENNLHVEQGIRHSTPTPTSSMIKLQQVDVFGYTAIEEARRRGYIEIAKLLEDSALTFTKMGI